LQSREHELRGVGPRDARLNICGGTLRDDVLARGSDFDGLVLIDWIVGLLREQ
jgi:hypothetical protein